MSGWKYEGMTGEQALKQISESHTSDEEDEKIVKYLLLPLFPRCVITSGIVYPTGYGNPISIQQMAEVLLKKYKEAK